jgi:hypothetical protein
MKFTIEESHLYRPTSLFLRSLVLVPLILQISTEIFGLVQRLNLTVQRVTDISPIPKDRFSGDTFIHFT